MKLNKLLRFISVIMAAAILAGTLSVGAAALHYPYLDSDLQSNYNSIDQVTLTADQQASLLLDKVDVMLEDKDIYIDIPIIGDIDLRSIDSALSSIYDLTGNWALRQPHCRRPHRPQEQPFVHILRKAYLH